MDWIRGGLAAIITTAISFGAFSLYLHRQRRREIENPNHLEDEKRRAQNIAINIGSLVVHLVQIAGGLAASIPSFALLIFIGSASSLPKIDDLGFFVALFFGGWIVFAWTLRITDALDGKK